MHKKTLSLPILIALVVGHMIGTGIYILPASLAQFGTISLLSWVYTSIGAVFLALTFAMLSTRFPESGGPYAFCKGAFGKLVGSIVAYTYWLGNVISVAGIAVASVSYLGFITPILNSHSPSYLVHFALGLEISVVWFFTLINIAGIHFAGVVQLFITILKVTPLILIIIFGLGLVNLDHLNLVTLNNLDHYTAFSSAATLTFWAFIGLETATIPAENARNKDISRATILGTLITSSIYILSTFVLMGIIPVNELQHSQFPFADAAKQIFGAKSGLILSLCAVISGLGALNACILVQGQIVYAAARDGLLPKTLGKLTRKDAPIAGQIFSSSIITLFLILTLKQELLKQFNQIALLAGLLTLITYLLTTLAEIKLTLKNKKTWQNIIFNRSLIIAIIAFFYTIWMISNFDSLMIFYSIIVLLIPIPLYFILVE